jgi:ABC-type bacteriocin/lantibiotic exporter with double-glycine peptidase domain
MKSNKTKSNIIFWVLETILKYKKELYRVLFYSISLNIFGLVSPFVMMTIKDKIIVYQGLIYWALYKIAILITN